MFTEVLRKQVQIVCSALARIMTTEQADISDACQYIYDTFHASISHNWCYLYWIIYSSGWFVGEFIFDFSTNKEIMNQLEKDNKILIFLFCFFATGM